MPTSNKFFYLSYIAKNFENLTFTEKFSLLREAMKNKEITPKQFLKLTSTNGYKDELREKVIFNRYLSKAGFGNQEIRKVKVKRRSTPEWTGQSEKTFQFDDSYCGTRKTLIVPPELQGAINRIHNCPRPRG